MNSVIHHRINADADSFSFRWTLIRRLAVVMVIPCLALLGVLLLHAPTDGDTTACTGEQNIPQNSTSMAAVSGDLKKSAASDLSDVGTGKLEEQGTAMSSPTASMNIQEQLSQLKTLLTESNGSTAAELSTIKAIVELVKDDDSALDAVVACLTQDIGPARALPSALIEVLGSSGTPRAQQALVGIIAEQEWPTEERHMAIYALVEMPKPISDVDDWLKQLHHRGDDLSNSSLLALATIGSRLREEDPQRFEEISQYVSAAASGPDLDLEHRVLGLEAVRDLAPFAVPIAVNEAMASGSSLLREKAILSLARIPDDAALLLIRNAVYTDPSDNVRAAAASLFSNTARPGGLEDISYAATRDSSERVRAVAVQSLSAWSVVSSDALRLLTEIAGRDSSETVRQMALQALQPTDIGPISEESTVTQ